MLFQEPVGDKSSSLLRGLGVGKIQRVVAAAVEAGSYITGLIKGLAALLNMKGSAKLGPTSVLLIIEVCVLYFSKIPKILWGFLFSSPSKKALLRR